MEVVQMKKMDEKKSRYFAKEEDAKMYLKQQGVKDEDIDIIMMVAKNPILSRKSLKLFV